jgi:hypothetical protein
MTTFDKKQMDAIVDRFLGWKLPFTFGPDAGINFTLPHGMSREEAYAKVGRWPIGTNLFTADEARAMLEHVLDVTFIPDWSLLEGTQSSLRIHMKMLKDLRNNLSTEAAMLERIAAAVPAPHDAALCSIAKKLRAHAVEPSDETMTLQEVWEAAGGNPGIKPTRKEVIEALHQLDEVCDAAAASIDIRRKS